MSEGMGIAECICLGGSPKHVVDRHENTQRQGISPIPVKEGTGRIAPLANLGQHGFSAVKFQKALPGHQSWKPAESDRL